MAYAHTNSKGDTYYLHGRDVALRSGKNQKIYYFAKMVQTGALQVLPSGKIVIENEKTGLPILKTSEDKAPIGTAEVLNGEKIRITTERMNREAVIEPEEIAVEEETVWAEHHNGVEENNVIEEIEETDINAEVSTRREIKVDPWAIAALPGQLLLIGIAKLAMRAWEKSKENEKPTEVQEEEL